jgi:hypothetical protein
MCFFSNASASANNFTPPLLKCTCSDKKSCNVQQKIVHSNIASNQMDSCSTQQYNTYIHLTTQGIKSNIRYTLQ